MSQNPHADPNANGFSFGSLFLGILVTVIGGVIVAWIIQDARFAPAKQLSTGGQPQVTVINRLWLPVEITIDGQERGQVGSDVSKTFLLESYPVTISWKVIRRSNSGGEIGEQIGGIFDSVANGNTITIDHRVNDSFYFYPLLTNLTDSDCEIVINEGLTTERRLGILKAQTEHVACGYNVWYGNSNVVLMCKNGKTYYWGIRNGEGESINELIDSSNGVVQLTLTP